MQWLLGRAAAAAVAAASHEINGLVLMSRVKLCLHKQHESYIRCVTLYEFDFMKARLHSGN
jgi:hypothetical protein